MNSVCHFKINELNLGTRTKLPRTDVAASSLHSYNIQKSIEPSLLSKSLFHCPKSEPRLATQLPFTMYKLVRSRAFTSAVRAAKVRNLQNIDSSY